MSELSQEQQKALDEQKKQCPFCKIISGKIPAKVAFQDSQVTAILDINPLREGHSLILPKEHYPIMPLITQPDFVKLFRVVKDYGMAQKRALLKTGVTVFIANGAAAGQISPHFMIHVIPREKGDNISLFNVVGKKSEPDQEIEKILANNLPIMMENHLSRNPEEWHKPKEISANYSKEHVIMLIEKNLQLKDFMNKNPEEFVKQAKTNAQLKTIFANVDIYEIISHFNPGYKVKAAEVVDEITEKGVPEEEIKEEQQTNPEQADEHGLSQENTDTQQVQESPETSEKTDIKQALGKTEEKISEPTDESEGDEPMTKEEVIDALEDSPKALALIKTNPEEFIVKAQEIPGLMKMFVAVDINEIIAHFNPKFGKEYEKEDKPSLDDITDLL